MNVSWEDTARTKGSAWGPNIIDMKLNHIIGSSGVAMPVIRKNNFADMDIDKFTCHVGNRVEGAALVSLREY